ncbi:helix-turn-helix domain-containing protein [Thermincola potens]|uniref:helix-turn-helix domain-containing protein n=1 Tax=Thermincola potens TaxID=863643 RepID=UPI003D7D3CFD
MTIREAAEILSLSERQVKRIKKGVKEYGEAFVIHKNRGRKPSHALTDEVKNLVVNLKNRRNIPKLISRIFRSCLRNMNLLVLASLQSIGYLCQMGLQAPRNTLK